MPKTSSLTPQKVIKLLESRGFVLDGSKGSHQFSFIQKPGSGLWCHFIAKICLLEHCWKFCGRLESARMI